MAAADIPQDVIAFLGEHIDSVVLLEILLLLHSKPEIDVQAAKLAQDLRIDPVWTESALSKLAASGILAPGADRGSYRYAPRTPEMNQTIASLAHEYGNRRVSIISAIFAKPTDPIRQFTDAFRFRKQGDSG